MKFPVIDIFSFHYHPKEFSRSTFPVLAGTKNIQKASAQSNFFKILTWKVLEKMEKLLINRPEHTLNAGTFDNIHRAVETVFLLSNHFSGTLAAYWLVQKVLKSSFQPRFPYSTVVSAVFYFFASRPVCVGPVQKRAGKHQNTGSQGVR